MKDSGIYKIESIIHPDRIYIGSAKKFSYRRTKHFYKLKNNNHENGKLQNHVNKYGIEDLNFIIIEKCNILELLIREQYYIDTLNPFFNICKIAGNTLGRRPSEETLVKMRNRVCSNETREKLRKSNTGKRLTEEEKFNRRKNYKHWSHSKETIEKMKKPKSKIAILNAKLGFIKFRKEHPLTEKERNNIIILLKHNQELYKQKSGNKYIHSKKVINIITNEIFQSIKDAAESIGWTSCKLAYWLKKENNKTNFKYYNENEI